MRVLDDQEKSMLDCEKIRRMKRAGLAAKGQRAGLPADAPFGSNLAGHACRQAGRCCISCKPNAAGNVFSTGWLGSGMVFVWKPAMLSIRLLQLLLNRYDLCIERDLEGIAGT